MTLRILVVAGALLVALASLPGEAGAEWTWPPSEEVMDSIEENLSRHYEGGELRAYLEGADTEQREAVEFLLAWLPPSDLGALPAETLIENVELALASCHEAPWSDEIDPYIFHTYILPHRVTQEPVQRWRPKLRELTTPRVAEMDLTEAALEINRFAREWVTYKPSSRRDQGPLTTMERGIGRCEEEMIFVICALRSAGIPARYCAVPCWCTGDGNHAWTEVYTGSEKGWRYIGSCEPAACLDQAWFTRIARRTGAVLSAGYGEAPVPDEYAETLYAQADGVTTLNSIGVYSDPGTLVLAYPAGHAPQEGSDEAPGEQDMDPPDAYVHTFNWGGAQPLVQQPLGSEILLGPGDYLVTAEIDSAPWSALASILPGQETQLELAPGFGVLDEPVWLHYPMPPEDDTKGCPIEEDDPVWLRHQRDTARRDLDRCKRSHPSSEWVEFLAGRPGAAELSAQIELAGPLTEDWTSAALAFTGDTLDLAVDLLLEMDIKDFYEMSHENLGAVLAEVVRVRDAAPTAAPDSLWNRYVLSPRLYFQEGTMSWWTTLPWLGENGRVPSTAVLLDAFRERVTELETTRLGATATPEDTWQAGYAPPASARACLVGLMRRHGIPARAERGVDYVDAWEDGEWTRLMPFEEDEEDEESGSDVAEEGYLAVSYFDQSAPLAGVETWRQTRLTRFQEGRFQTWYLGQISEGDGVVEWSLPADEYWLFGGLRNPRGEPRFIARHLVIAPGDSMFFDMDVGIPLVEWEPADLVQKEWDSDAPVEVVRNGAAGLLDDIADGTRLFVLSLTGHEASFRHLSALDDTDWEALGVSFVPIQVNGLPDHPTDPSAVTLDISTAETVFGIKNPKDQLPLTILLNEADGTLVWFGGSRVDMAEHLQRVLKNR